ncbi:MAG: hypothetical protein IKB67_02140 [Clostridia bacterium]|nr:hypothetical protein [Clostridia bacterium]
MYYEKIYLTVIAEFNAVGGMRPTVITWQDGKRYIIDKIKVVERAPCKSGGVLPVRYTVEICGQTKYLYYERTNERFFVEREV